MANIPRAAKLKIAHCSNDHNLLNTPFSMIHLQRWHTWLKANNSLKTQSSLNKMFTTQHKTKLLYQYIFKILNLSIDFKIFNEIIQNKKSS